MCIRDRDICFPVTKEFREKLYGKIFKNYKEIKIKTTITMENVNQKNKR